LPGWPGNFEKPQKQKTGFPNKTLPKTLRNEAATTTAGHFRKARKKTWFPKQLVRKPCAMNPPRVTATTKGVDKVCLTRPKFSPRLSGPPENSKKLHSNKTANSKRC
jgi:hypothetical protein